jgi:predicted TIM-barrel fold metal-dependent hydrolase
VRLEQVAEDVVSAGTSATDFPSRYTEALASAAKGAVAVKSVAAYRHGLDIEPGRPTANEVHDAAAVWIKEWAGHALPRLRSPVLLRFLLWSAIDLGLPVQIHTGFGDRDLDLHRCNPLLMTEFIRAAQPAGVPLLLLHCYPYHREAGYLAQVYPHVYCDVGLALNFTGARAHAVLAESLELAPFGKALYSSDAFGLPELHFLGAVVFRRAFERVTNEWLRDGLLTPADAARIGEMIGAGNARRVYRLSDGPH